MKSLCDINSILPQQKPFVMVDALVEFSMEKASTVTRVSPDNIFTDSHGFFSFYGLIENVAQTCAAKIGYYNKYILKKDVMIGVIGAIKNFKVKRFPQVGETIVTTVTTIEDVFGMTLIRGDININNELIADCEMKIAIYNK